MKKLGLIFLGLLMGVGATLLMGRGCKRGNTLRAEHRGARNEADVFTAIKNHLADTVTYYRDRYNQEHAEKALVQGDAAAVRAFYKQKEDSLCRVLKIQNHQLQSMTEVVSSVRGSFTTGVDNIPVFSVNDTGNGGSPLVGDVRYIRHFAWHDDFMAEEAWVDSSTATVQYNMTLPVYVTTYWKRKWFLGKKHYFIDGYSTNKNVHISGLTGISINK